MSFQSLLCKSCKPLASKLYCKRCLARIEKAKKATKDRIRVKRALKREINFQDEIKKNLIKKVSSMTLEQLATYRPGAEAEAENEVFHFINRKL